MDFAEYERRLDQRHRLLATVCVHAGDAPDPQTRALATPIVLASAYAFDDAEHATGAFRGENDAYIYGRWGNPTVRALEAKLAAIETGLGVVEACATASGMAAVSGALLSICESGSHIVAPRSMYGETARLLRERLPKLGIATTFVDATNGHGASYEAALRPETRVLYIESPSNPVLGVTDIAPVVALARARGLVTIADNTFATPFCQNPLALGVDLVVHSMTKALGGHGDAIGGAIVGAPERLAPARETVVKGLGGVMSPLTAYFVARGLTTFALRQRQACASAAYLADKLEAHSSITSVHHPALASHPAHAIARGQMHAFGSLLAFELRGGLEAAARLLGRLRVITHAVSLGDARSLLTHPASTTHSTMPPEDRARAGITDGLVRLSVGLEAREDLERDLLAALDIDGSAVRP